MVNFIKKQVDTTSSLNVRGNEDDGSVGEKKMHYIFLMDDVGSIFTERKKSMYKLFTQNRQSGISIIFTTQSIQFTLSSIKTNIHSIHLLGDLTSNDCYTLVSSFSQISKIFPNSQKLQNFLNIRKNLFTTPDKVVSIFCKNFYKKYINIPQNIIYVFLLNKTFCELVTSAEKNSSS